MSDLVAKVRAYVTPLYDANELEYHCNKHVAFAEEAALKLVKLMNLEEETEKVEELQIAVLFHDLAYREDPMNHEQNSAEKAADFLHQEQWPEERIERVKRLILATDYAKEPQNKWEKIIKDADTAHLGSDKFKEFSSCLRTEVQKQTSQEMSEHEWDLKNEAFLENHQFFTKPAQKIFEPKKWMQLQNLKAKRRTHKVKNVTKQKTPDRGIETMFRVALRNHNALSQIADNKANMVLSIVTIMLSLVLSSLVPKIDSNPELLIPTVILILVGIATIYFAVIASRPNVSNSNYSREKLTDNKINILFFGNFHDLPLGEFEWGIEQLMEDRDLLYGSLTKDLYFLGKVLAKKYKALRIAYSIFLYGLMVDALAFVVAMLMN